MKFYFRHAGQTHVVELNQTGEKIQAVVDGKAVEVKGSLEHDLEMLVAGVPVKAIWAKQGRTTWLHVNGRSYELERTAGSRAGGQAPGAESSLRAPMPGQVLKIFVEPGQAVADGAVLAVIEAMKMEVRILAPQAAKVAQVAVREGQSVEKDQLLVELEPDAG